MKKVIYGVISFAPVLAFAADLEPIKGLIGDIQEIFGLIVPLLFGLATIYFFWGVIKYIRSAGDPKEAEAGKSIMIYGIIGLAVMASVYGLVNFLTDTVGLDDNTIDLPDLPGSTN